jgi:hypothetical protein
MTEREEAVIITSLCEECMYETKGGHGYTERAEAASFILTMYNSEFNTSSIHWTET